MKLEEHFIKVMNGLLIQLYKKDGNDYTTELKKYLDSYLEVAQCSLNKKEKLILCNRIIASGYFDFQETNQFGISEVRIAVNEKGISLIQTYNTYSQFLKTRQIERRLAIKEEEDKNKQKSIKDKWIFAETKTKVINNIVTGFIAVVTITIGTLSAIQQTKINKLEKIIEHQGAKIDSIFYLIK